MKLDKTRTKTIIPGYQSVVIVEGNEPPFYLHISLDGRKSTNASYNLRGIVVLQT